MVENARPKAAGDPLDALEDGRHGCAQDAEPFASSRQVMSLFDGPEADQDRSQGLRGLVVELTGDPAPLHLLCRDVDVGEERPERSPRRVGAR